MHDILCKKKLKVEALTRYFEAFARWKQGTLPHSPLDPSLPGKAPVELCLSAGFLAFWQEKVNKKVLIAFRVNFFNAV